LLGRDLQLRPPRQGELELRAARAARCRRSRCSGSQPGHRGRSGSFGKGRYYGRNPYGAGGHAGESYKAVNPDDVIKSSPSKRLAGRSAALLVSCGGRDRDAQCGRLAAEKHSAGLASGRPQGRSTALPPRPTRVATEHPARAPGRASAQRTSRSATRPSCPNRPDLLSSAASRLRSWGGAAGRTRGCSQPAGARKGGS